MEFYMYLYNAAMIYKRTSQHLLFLNRPIPLSLKGVDLHFIFFKMFS